MQEMRTALEKGRAVVLSLLDCEEDTEEEQVETRDILSMLKGEGKRVTLVHLRCPRGLRRRLATLVWVSSLQLL